MPQSSPISAGDGSAHHSEVWLRIPRSLDVGTVVFYEEWIEDDGVNCSDGFREQELEALITLVDESGNPVDQDSLESSELRAWSTFTVEIPEQELLLDCSTELGGESGLLSAAANLQCGEGYRFSNRLAYSTPRTGENGSLELRGSLSCAGAAAGGTTPTGTGGTETTTTTTTDTGTYYTY